MKLKHFLLAMLTLVLFASGLFVSCAKDETTSNAATVKTEKVNAATDRSTTVEFNDITPPTTYAGQTVEAIWMEGDCVKIHSVDLLNATRLIYNNVCSVNPDTLALSSWKQGDTLKIIAPADWRTCKAGQPSGQVWDLHGEY